MDKYQIFERKQKTIISEKIIEIPAFDSGCTDWNNPHDLIQKNISTCKNVRFLMVDCKHSDISFLELLPNLEYVWLLNIKDPDLGYLRFLKKTKSLSISPRESYPYKEEHVFDLEFIKKIKLRELELHSYSIDSNQFENFKHLESLSLVWCKYQNLHFLTFNSKITSLFINTLPCTSINGIQYLPDLRRLSLLNNESFRNNKIEDFSFLHGLRNLKTIDFKGTDITKREVDRIAKNIPGVKFENLKIKRGFGFL